MSRRRIASITSNDALILPHGANLPPDGVFGNDTYRFLPVRLLMKDQFRSDLRIARVTAPLLFLHGGRDWVVPIALGERLYALANEPKQFMRFSDAGHEDVDMYGAQNAVRAFLMPPSPEVPHGIRSGSASSPASADQAATSRA